VNEGFERCRKFVDGWLQHADPQTGLIPRNLKDGADIWNAKDAGADNYPFMVLTAALTDSALFQSVMKKILASEELLTSRVGRLPDTYQFSKGGFASDSIMLDNIIFGASEYIKDGLMPLTEWLGKSPWSDRMIGMLDDIWANAQLETPYGRIPSLNVEVNGELLQVMARLYWMTGDQKYLDWSKRLANYYLLGSNHPTRDFQSLRLRDHGCEIVSGLCEFYIMLHYAVKDEKHIYQPQIHEMLDRILEVGRNSDGLFYDAIDPQTGQVLIDRVADNFGYNLNGFYSVYQIDSIHSYREAALKALSALDANYRTYAWEGTSADGYADAIEGALNLYNREPVASVTDWMDSEIQVMWSKQQDDGIIEGWHGDGNFARTTIMYCLWKTKGITLHPWRSDLQLGAVMQNDTIWVTVEADSSWHGHMVMDRSRHREAMHLPHDWPRINQFPEWFTVPDAPNHDYKLLENRQSTVRTASDLRNGLTIHYEDQPLKFKIYPILE